MTFLGVCMKKILKDYLILAKSLLKDKPIYELGSNKTLCYRVADERELAAYDAIVDLSETITKAEEDLERFAVCGTCSHLKHCKQHHQSKRQNTVPIDYNTACYKWKWRGTALDVETKE